MAAGALRRRGEERFHLVLVLALFATGYGHGRIDDTNTNINTTRASVFSPTRLSGESSVFNNIMANLCSNEFSVYHGVFIASLVFTCGLSLYARSQRHFEHDLPKGQKVYLSCGAVKVAIGILLGTVLYPKDCVGLTFAYPIVAIVIGVHWMLRGLKFRSEAARVAQAQGGGRASRRAVASTDETFEEGDDIETGVVMGNVVEERETSPRKFAGVLW